MVVSSCTIMISCFSPSFNVGGIGGIKMIGGVIDHFTFIIQHLFHEVLFVRYYVHPHAHPNDMIVLTSSDKHICHKGRCLYHRISFKDLVKQSCTEINQRTCFFFPSQTCFLFFYWIRRVNAAVVLILIAQ